MKWKNLQMDNELIKTEDKNLQNLYPVVLSIIIITWNNAYFLNNCLKSIYEKINHFNFEVIVIDNGSNDNTISITNRNFPNVKLIQNPTNRGVAAARNQGIKYTRGKYILLLDVDTIIPEVTFSRVIEFMESSLDAGIVGVKLTDINGNLQLSCRSFPSPQVLLLRRLTFFPFVASSKTLRNYTLSDWDHQQIKEIDYVIGACQLIRRAAIDRIGLLDEKMFYGMEDVDYCIRMWKNGWKVYYYPFVQIIHLEQRRTYKRFLSRLSYEQLKSTIYFFRKHGVKISR